MAAKTTSHSPSDDWAGLAQNLFGINLGKPSGDDDLLDDDMFKVEIPKPPAPPPAVAIQPSAPVAVPVAEKPDVVARPVLKPVAKRVVIKMKAVAEDDPFGAGILEDTVEVEEEEVVENEVCFEADDDDDGITLEDDFDAEGLTLPADYDDGLTLAMDSTPDEVVATADVQSDDDSESDEESDDDFEEDDDEEVATANEGEHAPAGDASRSEGRSRRKPRRTREDAYWDMLENWEWEEITDDDAPPRDAGRSGGSRDRRSSGSGGGGRDRNRSGGRSSSSRSSSDRSASSDQSRSTERPRRDETPRSEERPRRDQAVRSDERPRTEQTQKSETAGRVSSADSSSTREQRPRREDRPRESQGRGPSGQRRDESQAARSVTSPVVTNHGGDDFGSGIFEEPAVSKGSDTQRSRPTSQEALPQTARSADPIRKETHQAKNTQHHDELVWPEDDDSDVRSAPVTSVVETAPLPSTDAEDDSDLSIDAGSDVEPIGEEGERDRPRRRRRRRRGPRSETRSETAEGDGTTFDLSDALVGSSDTPDFIPVATSDDAEASDDQPASDGGSDGEDEDRTSERRGRRRRRRRRRPGESERSEESPSEEPRAAESHDDELEEDVEDDAPRIEREPAVVVQPINYGKIPSWEEAIKYLLQPNLVGRNLGPDDEAESLEGDPRGSGGAEPIETSSSSRRSSGGNRGSRGGRGGSGRRPPPPRTV